MEERRELRIISLLPSATEILCALGLRNEIVGRSHECDYPDSIEEVPVCTTSLVGVHGSSYEIDRQVKELHRSAEPLYQLDRSLFEELDPTLIISQSQCEVCAVDSEMVKQQVGAVLSPTCQILDLAPATLDDIFENIARIGRVTQAEQAAELLLEDLQNRSDVVRHKLKFFDQKPTVACVEWLDPMMLAGNWTPELINMAGGIPLGAQPGLHSAFLNLDDLVSLNPEILLFMPCGYPIAKTLGELPTLLQNAGWQSIKAVQNNRVYVADGSRYFNRPGPRIIDSLEIAAEILYPKQFYFGYEGEAWVRFEVS